MALAFGTIFVKSRFPHPTNTLDVLGNCYAFEINAFPTGSLITVNILGETQAS